MPKVLLLDVILVMEIDGGPSLLSLVYMSTPQGFLFFKKMLSMDYLEAGRSITPLKSFRTRIIMLTCCKL